MVTGEADDREPLRVMVADTDAERVARQWIDARYDVWKHAPYAPAASLPHGTPVATR